MHNHQQGPLIPNAFALLQTVHTFVATDMKLI